MTTQNNEVATEGNVYLKVFTGEHSDVAMARTRNGHFITNLDSIHPLKQQGYLLDLLRSASRGELGDKIRVCINHIDQLNFLNSLLVAHDYGDNLARELGYDVDFKKLTVVMVFNNRDTYQLDPVEYVPYEGFTVPWYSDYIQELLTTVHTTDKLMEKHMK